MIDTHAHIDTEIFDEDRLQVLAEAFDSGVEAIIIPSIEPKDFKRVFHTVGLSDKLFCAVGIHPHNASEVTDEQLINMEKLARNNNKVVAIGEIGLDYYYDFNPPDLQKRAFAQQLKLAKKLHLPVIVHNRESDEDMLEVLRQEKTDDLDVVLHCFSSDEKMLKEVIDMGCHVSFTGNITFKKSTLDNVVKLAPLNKIMLETDSPYMTPVPFRGKKNKPANVQYVAEKIAQIKDISTNEVIEMTTNNAKRFFNIIALAMFMLFASNSLLAQTEEYFEDYEMEQDSIESMEEDYFPYRKSIGIFPVLGTNTIIETFFPLAEERSYEGILAYGGGLNCFLTDYFSLQASYLYSMNDKDVVKNPDWGLKPNYYHMYELSLLAYTAPWKRINFFGVLGTSFSHNNLSIGKEITDIVDAWGVNVGLGFLANFDLDNAGILTVSAEWRVDFILDRNNYEVDPRYGDDDDRHFESVDTESWYSIPRFYLTWYPKF